MKVEQRIGTPTFAPHHNVKKNHPGDTSPGSVQAHHPWPDRSIPAPMQCQWDGCSQAMGAPRFAGSAENSNNLRVNRDIICCSFYTTCLSPFGKTLLPLTGRVASLLPAVACTQKLSSVKRNCRPEKDNLFPHPSTSLHSRIWIYRRSAHPDSLIFNKTLQCLCADCTRHLGALRWDQ